MGGAFVFVMAAHLCTVAGVKWAGFLMEAVVMVSHVAREAPGQEHSTAHVACITSPVQALFMWWVSQVMLAARNSLGLPVARKTGRIQPAQLIEKAVVPGCLAIGMVMLVIPRLGQHVEGSAIAAAAAIAQIASLLGVAVGLAATQAERFTQSAMRDMLRGLIAVQWALSSHMLSLVLPHGQVAQVGARSFKQLVLHVSWCWFHPCITQVMLRCTDVWLLPAGQCHVHGACLACNWAGAH